MPDSGSQIVPFEQQRPQLNIGGRSRRGSFSQLDHLPAQFGCPVKPAVYGLYHPQVGKRGHPGVMVARLLGSLIDFHERLLRLPETATIPMSQAKRERYQTAGKMVRLR